MSDQPQPSIPSEEAQIYDQRLTSYRFVIICLVAFIGFSMGLSMYATGPIMPLIIDYYGINHSTASLLTGLVALVQLGFAIPSAIFVSRVGLKTLVAFGSLTSSAPLLSFIVVGSFPLVLALRAIYGLGSVVLFPALGPLMMQWFRSRELPLANGVFTVFLSLGIAMSTFLVSPLTEEIGWDSALSVFGGISLLSALAWIAFGRTQRIVQNIEVPLIVQHVWGILSSRTTLLVVLADIGPFALLTVSLAWLPTFYNEAHDMSLTKAGVLMGVLSVAGLVALVTASLLPIWIHRRRPFLVIPGVLVGFAGFGAFLLADSVAVYIAVVVLGFACWVYLPILLTIPMELYPKDPSRVAMIFATVLSLGGLATFLAPLAVGGIADVTGSFVPGLALFAAAGWSLGIAGFLMPETSPILTEQGGTHVRR